MLRQCKFYLLPEYYERLEGLFETLNMFEVAQFEETHELIEISTVDEIPEDMAAEDIVAIDETTWEVFVEHLPCYFSIKER